jgi:hypothetical protein
MAVIFLSLCLRDGEASELKAALSLSAVQKAARDEAIFDLLLMSRAQLIITAASSTFGYWAGFLADAAVILHPDHIYAPHRPIWINKHSFEGRAIGSFASWPDLLGKNVKNIRISAALPYNKTIPTPTRQV